MIKKLTIKNFKAIRNLTLELTPFTVLIGENSSGKSTVLQALHFLCSIVSRDIDEYLGERDWDFDEIKSQFAASDESVRFAVEFHIDDSDLLWDISINNSSGKWDIQESITDVATKECYLSFGRENDDYPHHFSELNINSSALKMMDIGRVLDGDKQRNPELFKIKRILVSSTSFELLSPDKMRSKSSRGKVSNIGIGGEKLVAFIHGMPSNKKHEFNKTVSEFIGYDVKISTTTNGQPGWVEMYLEENWCHRVVKVRKPYISDGLLRIIAFAAIIVGQGARKSGQTYLLSEDNRSAGLIMLDEIENGINPKQSEELIECFKQMTRETDHQFVITSHSPVMINFVDENDITFMWRDHSGMIHAQPLFQALAMKEALDILGPGEVWLNYPKNRIIEMLSTQEKEHD